MKKTQVFFLFVCIILILGYGIIYADEIKTINVDVPLPDDIKIIACGKDVPKKIAAFSGVWEGEWGIDGVESVLVVEEINSKEAKVIYCQGEMKGYYNVPAGYERYKAIVKPENLQIEFGRHEKYWFIFSMEENLNKIKGTFKRPTSINKIEMTKIK